MLKTIIIDDEDLIREGLKDSIQWADLGFDLVGEACDGESAIELIQTCLPDVIITDIRMPFMNGLELVEFIKPLLPDAFIIIISGHDEFHYAQKALQLGVYDFMLKPLDLDVFIKTLTKIKYEYTLVKNKKQLTLPEEDLIQLQNDFIESALLNKYDSDQIKSKISTYKLEYLADYFFTTIIVQIDNFHLSVADYTFDQINEIQNSYYALIYKAVIPSSKIHIFEGTTGDAIISIAGDTRSGVSMKTDKITTQLRDLFNRESELSITIAVSDMIETIHQLHTSYRQAHKACNERFVQGYNNTIYHYNLKDSNVNNNYKSNYPQIGFIRGDFINLLKANDPVEISNYLNHIFEELVNKGHNSSLFVTMFVISVYVEILNFLTKYDYSIGEIYNDPLILYRNLSLSYNIHDSRDLIKEISQKAAAYVASQNSTSCNTQIQEAKNYIKANFASPDITLQEVAEHVNMGVCYFSSIFKKETGESFINYLTSVRIEKAKELFETTFHKSYEISYLVGYNTPTYFSTLFKKITGYSPSDYRNLQ